MYVNNALYNNLFCSTKENKTYQINITGQVEFSKKNLYQDNKNDFVTFRYLNTYKKYADLLNNKADQDVSAFLREPHTIQAFKSVSFAIFSKKHITSILLLLDKLKV